jgi:hypothetical protein
LRPVRSPKSKKNSILYSLIFFLFKNSQQVYQNVIRFTIILQQTTKCTQFGPRFILFLARTFFGCIWHILKEEEKAVLNHV